MKLNYSLILVLFAMLPACNNRPKTPVTESPETAITGPADTILTKRPLMVEFWGGYYDSLTVGPLDAIPDGVDVVNIFTMGVKDSIGWEFAHNPVSKYNNWNDVLVAAHNLQKRGIRVVCSIFPTNLLNLPKASADSMAQVVKDSLDQWQLDGINIDLEAGSQVINIDSAVIALSKYIGPASKTGRILSVVDYDNLNIETIQGLNKYIDYVMTMSYWNTAKMVGSIVGSYGAAIGSPKNVLIGVGQGCGIGAGQQTPAGQQIAIADTLRIAFPGTGMMEFLFGCSYHDTLPNGSYSKNIDYTLGIIKHLKQ